MTFIILPLTAAALTRRFAGKLAEKLTTTMVLLLVLTLFLVVATNLAALESAHLRTIALAIPLYLGFAASMTLLGGAAARTAKLDRPGTVSLIFSGVTRNSLVVLPLVYALPEQYQIAPLVVVAQTLTELLIMVALIQLLKPPRFSALTAPLHR